MFPLDFLKTIGQGIGGGVKKILPREGTAPGSTFKAPTVPITPGINPNAAMPSIAAAREAPRIALPAPPMNPPPKTMESPFSMDLERRGVPLPALPGESGPKSYSPMEAARYDYHRARMRQPGDEKYDGTGQYKRSGKDILRNTLMGFFQGAAADPRNPLAGGLGGAATAGIGSAISPQGSAEYGFQTQQRPQVERQMADEDAELKREQAIQRAKWAGQLDEEKLLSMRADREYNQARASAPVEVSPGATLMTRDGKVLATAPPLPARPGTAAKPPALLNTKEGIYDPVARQWVERYSPKLPTQAEALQEVYAEDGTAESIAESSLAGRQDSLLQQLTPQERAYLNGPPSQEELAARLSPRERDILSGAATDATDAETTKAYANWDRLQQGAANDAARARDKWNQIQTREREKILRETRGEASRKATERRTGGARPKLPQQGAPAPSQSPTRPRSQFNSQKFPGLKFD